MSIQTATMITRLNHTSRLSSVRSCASLRGNMATQQTLTRFSIAEPNMKLQASQMNSKISCTCQSVLAPIFGIVFNPILLGCLWAVGAVRFWNNYSKTTYTPEKKALLTALWPGLYIANATYRAQFTNAVKGD